MILFKWNSTSDHLQHTRISCGQVISPIRGQCLAGHVICIDQSEASIHSLLVGVDALALVQGDGRSVVVSEEVDERLVLLLLVAIHCGERC